VLARVLSILTTEVEDLEGWQVDLCQGLGIQRANTTLSDKVRDMMTRSEGWEGEDPVYWMTMLARLIPIDYGGIIPYSKEKVLYEFSKLMEGNGEKTAEI